MRVKCLAQEPNTMTRPGLEPGPLDPESSVLTTRPPHRPQIKIHVQIKINYLSPVDSMLVRIELPQKLQDTNTC